MMRIRGLGRLRWPWKASVVTPAERAPRVMLNRYPGQVIGIAFRLPDETVYGRGIHKQLSITWARPDVKQYPAGWADRPRRDVLFGTRNPVMAARQAAESRNCRCFVAPVISDAPRMSIDEAAEALGIELLPWQQAVGRRLLNGERVVWLGTKRAGVSTLQRVLAHAVAGSVKR